jgi:hypothetical protein
MRAGKIKVAWLTGYPITRLRPEVAILRSPKLEHPAGWVVNLSGALAKREDIELQIIAASPVIAHSQSITRDGITFNVIRHAVPFTARGFPGYLRLDLWSGYAVLRWHIKRLLRSLRPDAIHVHGTESGYGLGALGVVVAAIVSVQGIVLSAGARRPFASSHPYNAFQEC